MKLIKIICLGLFISLFAVSCKETSKSLNDAGAKASQSENLKNIEIKIEGMTCQIGCARTIESKLSKTEGVSSVAISFEDNLGKIVYDANKISKDDITKQITGIAGGDTYSISSVKVISGSCCSADLKTCMKKCSETCSKEACDTCVVVQAQCKEKCTVKKQVCCASKANTCKKKCSTTCTKVDCDTCVKIAADCKSKCA